jgi:hypothetical protein
MELSNKVEELHGQQNESICSIYRTINFFNDGVKGKIKQKDG